MKNNFFFLLLFLLIGCVSSKVDIIKVSCPNVYFASEHVRYIAGETYPITVDNISYRAEINNHAFNSGCSILNQKFEAELSLLFIVKPDQNKVSNVTLPFYVAILNENNKLIDIQYYMIDGKLMRDSEDSNYIETELSKTVRLQIPIINNQENYNNTIIVGFMLDKKKLEILN